MKFILDSFAVKNLKWSHSRYAKFPEIEEVSNPTELEIPPIEEIYFLKISIGVNVPVPTESSVIDATKKAKKKFAEDLYRDPLHILKLMKTDLAAGRISKETLTNQIVRIERYLMGEE